MAATSRTIVIVDPNEGRRDRIAAEFRRYFEVYTVSGGDLALSTMRTMRPQVVLVHMQQIDGDGHTLCHQLRESNSSRGCILVLHGQDHSLRNDGGAIARVQTRPSADLVLNHDLTPRDLLRAVAQRLKNGPQSLAPVSAPVEFYSARRVEPQQAASTLQTLGRHLGRVDSEKVRQQLQWRAVKGALTRPLTPLIHELPADRPLSLREALLAKPSLRNLRLILETPVTPLVPVLPLHRTPTRTEILRAQVTPHNLRVVGRLAISRLTGRPARAPARSPSIHLDHLPPGPVAT